MEKEADLRLKVENLEKQVKYYEKVLSNIPFQLEYKDFYEGFTLSKSRGNTLPIIDILLDEGANPLEKQLKMDLSIKDLPFEEIEAFLYPILDLVPYHIVFIDKLGRITFCNKQTADDLKVRRQNMIGKHLRDLLQIPDDLIMLLKTLQTKEPIYNLEVLDSNYGIVNTRIIFDNEGNILRVIGTFHFLNSIKESEKQALAGRIAAGIAHEIRNPLTTVRGYLQYLQQTIDPTIAILFKDLLIPELDRANKIISDFLSVARPSDRQRKPININTFLEYQLGYLLRSEALLQNVNISFDLATNTNDYLLLSNQDELIQVFLNLFRNAMEAQSQKHLHITITSKIDTDRLVITFEDNGIGISQKNIDHIFDPFFSTKDSGTGLGLSISKKIIENYGGTMRVKSKENLGSTFIIEFPVEIQSRKTT
ncbi:GHKL domain-containing protein [Bacillus timonensis]|nr:GHKL domain-containing protein [Bacillus timonensis]